MSDLIKQKLDIAKRAGELHKELSELLRIKTSVDNKKKLRHLGGGVNGRETIQIMLDSKNDVFSSRKWDEGSDELHNLVILYIDRLIAKREQELDELIKILQ